MAEKAAEENKALEEFKTKITNVAKAEHDDFCLKQWLVAKNYDVDKAEKMYRASMAQREKLKVDTSLRDYRQLPEVLQNYMVGGNCGHDKEGCPIRVELFGRLDMRGIMSSCKKTDLERHKLIDCEETVHECQLQTKQLGKRVYGLTVILDMENTGMHSLWRPGLRTYFHVLGVLEDNYPSLVKKTLVVNAPRIFPLLWKICRPLMSDEIRKTIDVMGSDYKKGLLKYIDSEQLPEYLGGTLTDPDGNPRCITKIRQCGKVPIEYYLSEKHVPEDMCEVVVAKRDKLRLEFNVNRPGSILIWEFRTEDSDIGFSVTHKAGSSADFTEKAVVALERFNSHQVMHDDSLVCNETGIYSVIFDNTYSWLKAKKLWYTVEVLNSEDWVGTDMYTTAPRQS